MMLALRPILHFLAFTYNPNAYKKGFIYYYIPYFMTGISFLMNLLIDNDRPYPQCLIPYVHSENGLPCAEIALTASFACVDLMYGGNYYYKFMQCLIIMSMPILSWLTFTATIWQGFFTIVFTVIISIPSFLFVQKIKRIFKFPNKKKPDLIDPHEIKL